MTLDNFGGVSAVQSYYQDKDSYLRYLQAHVTCGGCVHSTLPSQDGVSGLDEKIGWCRKFECFIDPLELSGDVGCEDVAE